MECSEKSCKNKHRILYQRNISADVAQHHALETDKVWFDSWTAQRNYIEVCDACSVGETSTCTIRTWIFGGKSARPRFEAPLLTKYPIDASIDNLRTVTITLSSDGSWREVHGALGLKNKGVDFSLQQVGSVWSVFWGSKSKLDFLHLVRRYR